MKNKLFIVLLSFFVYSKISAQIINTPPFILTVDELKAWTSVGATADANNIATENLATRFSNASTQLNPSLNDDLKIAMLPDGMNNFGNYNGEQPVFNYYNFTNWAYVDKLVWFGGTASQTVQIPSAPWVNAAHKNGVKVFGNVFFAPTAWGGNSATVAGFLEKDGSGNFIAVTKLKEIMEYYNFDGWFINEETSGLGSVNGQLMYDFIKELTATIEPLGGEVIWYDAMLLNGNVSWQNYLSSNNFMFLQNDENNGFPNDGYEQRVSSSMFINFSWFDNTYTSTSNTNAIAIGRSPYDVFTGVDLWPGRNQSAFEIGGNTWMSDIHQTANSAYTSLGLFAISALYNNTQYSNFENDPNDGLNFYNAERHLFGGADNNPSIIDGSGFKGVSNWVPATSVINTLPFETNFNTGHGRKKFTNGIEVSSSDWHNMSDQELLPTWQFAVEGNQSIGASFDFGEAYNGGNSIVIEGMITGASPSTLKLYKTNLTIEAETVLELTYKTGEIAPTNMDVLLAFDDNPTNFISYNLGDSPSVNWNIETLNLAVHNGKKLVMIAFEANSTNTINPYSFNLGKLLVFNAIPLTVLSEVGLKEFSIYPNPSKGIFNVNLKSDSNIITIQIHDIKGRDIYTKNYNNSNYFSKEISLEGVDSGIYIITVSDGVNKTVNKLIIE